jgi:adenylylsulfate kinase-like enzyme
MCGINHSNSFVVWVCGLAGVGKTTFAKKLVWHLSRTHENVLHLDGDDFRRLKYPHVGYTRAERLIVARALSDEAWSVAATGPPVVVSTVSLLSEIHECNASESMRLKLPLYNIVVTAPEAFQRRTRAKLFDGLEGEVVGRDIAANWPTSVFAQVQNESYLVRLESEALQLSERILSETHAS